MYKSVYLAKEGTSSKEYLVPEGDFPLLRCFLEEHGTPITEYSKNGRCRRLWWFDDNGTGDVSEYALPGNDHIIDAFEECYSSRERVAEEMREKKYEKIFFNIPRGISYLQEDTQIGWSNLYEDTRRLFGKIKNGLNLFRKSARNLTKSLYRDPVLRFGVPAGTGLGLLLGSYLWATSFYQTPAVIAKEPGKNVYSISTNADTTRSYLSQTFPPFFGKPTHEKLATVKKGDTIWSYWQKHGKRLRFDEYKELFLQINNLPVPECLQAEATAQVEFDNMDFRKRNKNIEFLF